MFSCFWHIPDWTFVDILGFVWDAAKAAVPAGVAWVAYKVSVEAKEATQAQRDIALNQYNISLYDARSNAIHKIEDWLIENKEYKLESISDHFGIIYLFSNLNNIFNGEINYCIIEKTVSDIYLLHMEYVGLENKFSLIDDVEEYDRIKLHDARKKLVAEFDFLRIHINTLLHQVRNRLKIPDPVN